MIRCLFAALAVFSLANGPALAERGVVELQGEGPFSIAAGDNAVVCESNFDDAEIQLSYFGFDHVIRGTTRGNSNNPLDPMDFITVHLLAGGPGVVEIKFITRSRLPNIPIKARTIRVTVQ